MIKSINKPILSIDIGGSKLMVGVVDSSGRVLSKEIIFLKPDIDEEFVINTTIKLSSSLLNKFQNIDIDCAGVTVPGLTDSDKGIWLYSCFSGLRDLKIADILTYELKIPVFIDNDVNACAYGERLYGSCRDIDDFIWVTVSNGVGGGLFINGKLYIGAYKNAGEIGHINVVENGHICRCGNYGCLEAYAAGPAIVRRYCERTGSSSGGSGLNAKLIAEYAKKGDLSAIEIYKETGYYLGKAIASAVNIVNPRKVILGGGVAMDIELFFPELVETVENMKFKEANKELMIEKTGLSYDAALIGAAAVAQKGMGRVSL